MHDSLNLQQAAHARFEWPSSCEAVEGSRPRSCSFLQHTIPPTGSLPKTGSLTCCGHLHPLHRFAEPPHSLATCSYTMCPQCCIHSTQCSAISRYISVAILRRGFETLEVLRWCQLLLRRVHISNATNRIPPANACILLIPPIRYGISQKTGARICATLIGGCTCMHAGCQRKAGRHKAVHHGPSPRAPQRLTGHGLTVCESSGPRQSVAAEHKMYSNREEGCCVTAALLP
jgi:hypothetical protein